MMTAQEMERKTAARKKESFERWLNEPMVRMGMSMIPQGEHSDALKMLLQSAFEAGHASGGADIGITMLTAILDKKSKELPPG